MADLHRPVHVFVYREEGAGECVPECAVVQILYSMSDRQFSPVSICFRVVRIAIL